MVMRLLHTQVIGGSNPPIATSFRRWCSNGRAADCKSVASASRFDSYHLHQVWLVNIMVIMPACLAGHRGSIPLRVAKFMSWESTQSSQLWAVSKWNSCEDTILYAEVAQLVEHLSEEQGVTSSILVVGTKYYSPVSSWRAGRLITD